jgi:hypothetical protein
VFGLRFWSIAKKVGILGSVAGAIVAGFALWDDVICQRYPVLAGILPFAKCPPSKQVRNTPPQPAVAPVVVVAATKPQTCSELPDARQTLACRGIQWNEDNLLAAMRQGDDQTIKHFIDGGWKFDSDRFISLLMYGDAPDAMMRSFAQARAFAGTDFCRGWKARGSPSGTYYGSLSRLTEKPDRWAIFLSVCSREELRVRYDALIAAERKDLTEERVRAERDASPAAIEACKVALRSRFPVESIARNARSISADDEFLTQFNLARLEGGRGVSVQTLYDIALHRTCFRRPPEGAVSGARLEAFERIRKALR